MSSAVMKVAKPQLRNILASKLRKDVFVSVGAGLLTSALGWVFWYRPKWQRYAEYMATVDVEKDFQYMKARGVYSQAFAARRERLEESLEELDEAINVLSNDSAKMATEDGKEMLRLLNERVDLTKEQIIKFSD